MISHKWTPIEPLNTDQVDYDFGEIDSLQREWISNRERVEGKDPDAYKEFLERLGRSWAIETGILEGLYTIDRGVTETLVESGLVADYIERSSTNKDPHELVEILKDHQNSIELVDFWIKENRPLTKWFIRELHVILTKNQPTFKAVDQLGRSFDTELNKGEFKSLPNNPTRSDRLIHEYCPPEQVESQMDELLIWYELHSQEEHPLLVGTWLHHRFTQIHPFQDGNGRVVRAILTWHLVREGYLPVVISRDARKKYISTLEEADQGNLAPLLDFIVGIEKTTILQALSSTKETTAKATSGELIEQVVESIVEKVELKRQFELKQKREVDKTALYLREQAEGFFHTEGQKITEQLKPVDISIWHEVNLGGPDHQNEYWYRFQVIETASRVKNWVNFNEARYFVKLSLNPSFGSRNPRLAFVISMHHIGRQLTGVMAATAFAEIDYHKEELGQWKPSELFKDCTVNPFTFTWEDSPEKVSPRFTKWIEESLSIALKYWGEYLSGL